MLTARLLVQEKIEAIAKETYGAASVEYLPQAEKQIELYTKMGFGGLPICMAKTQYSFSADAAAKVGPASYLAVHCLEKQSKCIPSLYVACAVVHPCQ